MTRARTSWIGACAALLLVAAAAAAQPRTPFEGRRLEDALRVLQADGLRIVFTSEIVTPAMRVSAEPRASAPRKILDEVLRPHGLAAQKGPGGVILVVRSKGAAPSAAPPPAPPKPASVSDRPRGSADHPRDAVTFDERVTVNGLLADRGMTKGPSTISVSRTELRELGGAPSDDPMRALQQLPHVSPGDDFHSDISMRGSANRHASVLVDGISARWLRHAAYGRRDAGSLAMLTNDLVERAVVSAGGYPRLFEDRIGPQVELTIREGSRRDTTWRAGVSGTNASASIDGPIGRSGRGSWIAGFRQSFLDWPIRSPQTIARPVFGFIDGQAKAVYDVTSSQQLSATFLSGVSNIDEGDERVRDQIGDGTNRAALLSVGWRSMLGSSAVIQQRAAVATHDFLNRNQANEFVGDGADTDYVYRAEITRTMPGGLLQAGGQVQRSWLSRRAEGERVTRSATLQSAFAHYTWRPAASRITIAPGLRFTTGTLLDQPAISRWILAGWDMGAGLTLTGSAGVSYQTPDLNRTMARDPASLRSERARHLDIGVEHRIGETLRWRAAFFDRRESDLFSARGLEVAIEHHGRSLTGWLAYSYGAATAFAAYRPTVRTSIAATFRSGRPVMRPDQEDFLRLPTYARFDLRASRTVLDGARRVVVFAELVNVLNRQNFGLPRRPSAGLSIDF